MRYLLPKILITAAILIVAIPIGASAQTYRDRTYSRDRSYDRDRSYNRYDNRDQYDRMDRRQVRQAIQGLDNAAARLESDLNVNQGRRVLGIFWIGNTDNRSVSEVRDFRRAVRQFSNASNGGRDLRESYDEARVVLDRGMQLDRYLRLRTGSERVDADLSELRSNLNLIANAFNLTMTY
jgi:hypothetical protein